VKQCGDWRVQKSRRFNREEFEAVSPTNVPARGLMAREVPNIRPSGRAEIREHLFSTRRSAGGRPRAPPIREQHSRGRVSEWLGARRELRKFNVRVFRESQPKWWTKLLPHRRGWPQENQRNQTAPKTSLPPVKAVLRGWMTAALHRRYPSFARIPQD